MRGRASTVKKEQERRYKISLSKIGKKRPDVSEKNKRTVGKTWEELTNKKNLMKVGDRKKKASERWKDSKNPNYKPKLSKRCLNCNKKFYGKPSYIKKRKFCGSKCYGKNGNGMLGKKHSNITKLRMSINKKKFYRDNPNARIKIREERLKQKFNRISLAEKILSKYFKKNKIKFVSQYTYELGSADFYLPNINLIIECYGKYWHSLPLVKKRSKRQLSWFRKNDYKVLIFCSEDIVQNKNNLYQFVESRIQ